MGLEKICIVTGGSTGIGKSIADIFKKNNFKVINISRKPCDIDNVINLNFDLSSKSFKELDDKLTIWPMK